MASEKLTVVNEESLIDSLRMKGYVLKKIDEKSIELAIRNAYRAGKESGSAEIVMKMLKDLKERRKQITPVDILNAMKHGDDIISAEGFISEYLPERYRKKTK